MLAMTMEQTWTTVLRDLELQMTQATFNTWLKGTRCVEYDAGGDALVIAVKNEYAVEWLESRLYPVIQRTLHRVSGNGTGARFVVQDAAPSDIDVIPQSATEATPAETWKAPDFDPANTRKVSGWFPVPEYACQFWAPLLGRTAWRLWEIIRQTDIRTEKTDWTPARRWSAPALAQLVPCGIQALIGRNRVVEEQTPGAIREMIHPIDGPAQESWIQHQDGAFDRLQTEGVAEITPTGEKRHRVYTISVRSALPLLHPSQMAQLRAELQVKHERWVEAHGLDPELW